MDPCTSRDVRDGSYCYLIMSFSLDNDRAYVKCAVIQDKQHCASKTFHSTVSRDGIRLHRTLIPGSLWCWWRCTSTLHHWLWIKYLHAVSRTTSTFGRVSRPNVQSLPSSTNVKSSLLLKILLLRRGRRRTHTPWTSVYAESSVPIPGDASNSVPLI